jgi:hypothetical protein
MSNYHVMNLNVLEDVARVIFHIPVPDELNDANVYIRDALIQFLGSPPVSVLPWINAAEATAIGDGSMIEVDERIKFSNARLTLAGKRAEIDAAFAAHTMNKVEDLRKVLRFWGLNRDLP